MKSGEKKNSMLMQSATVIVPLVWRHKRKLSDIVGQNKNNANPATFPRVEPCSTNATMWPRRNVENSEVEKERMYYEGQEEIMKAYELQWGAFTRADLEHCRLKLLEITAFQQDGEKKKKNFPQSTDNTLKTYTVFGERQTQHVPVNNMGLIQIFFFFKI